METKGIHYYFLSYPQSSVINNLTPTVSILASVMKLSFAFFLLGSTITNSPLLVSAFSSPSITASSSAKGASTIHQRLSGLPTKFVNHRAGVLGSSSNEASKKYKLSILSQSASETLSTEDNSADEGKQGLPGATFSLVKAIVGSGVFSLSGKRK